jgi:Rap1a immunity proteins
MVSIKWRTRQYKPKVERGDRMKFYLNLERRVVMYQRLVKVLLIALMLSPGIAGAATDEDFEVKTTRNLINLCTVSASDPRAEQAIHFCHGYLVGAYHYYLAESEDPREPRLVCIPEKAVTRNEAIAMFVEWAKAHPQYMNERPVDTEFRFLNEKWPCKK